MPFRIYKTGFYGKLYLSDPFKVFGGYSYNVANAIIFNTLKDAQESGFDEFHFIEEV